LPVQNTAQSNNSTSSATAGFASQQHGLSTGLKLHT